jgi:TniQ
LNSALLLCHPQPFPTESYLGYALRLSEKNGYDSPLELYRLAGCESYRRIGLDTAILARLTCGRHSDLQAISYEPSSSHSTRVHLLGHQIESKRLLLVTAKLCPQCVVEKGFIEAHWDLKLMIGCPDHHCRAAVECPKCRKRLPRFRPGLLECRCGGDISKSALATISSDAVKLLALIRSKVLGTSLSGGEFSILPYQELLTMDLNHMLRTIAALGTRRLVVDNRPDANDEYQIVCAAAQVLKEWPTNFQALLRDIESRARESTSLGVGHDFDSICDALFRIDRHYRPSGRPVFFRNAFIEFATTTWEKGTASKALITRLRWLTSDRSMTAAECAARAGVCLSTATRYWRKNGRQALLQYPRNKPSRALVDRKHPVSGVVPSKVTHKDAAVKPALRKGGAPRA